MAKIVKDRFYSLLEVQKLTGIKTREYLSRYINEGKLLAIKTGVGGVRLRYAIRGSWVEDFIDRYENGNVRGKQYSKDEVRALLEKAIKDLK